jgi:hypothetical protein
MRNIIFLLIVFFLAVFGFNLKEKLIEPMCKIKKKADDNSSYECQNKQIILNKITSEKIDKNLNKLLNKLKKKAIEYNKNKKDLTTNQKNIIKLQSSASGKMSDNSEACAKYPEAC